MGLISSFLSILGFSEKSKNELRNAEEVKASKVLSLETQLNTFKKHGFILNQGIQISDIDRWDEGEKAFESEPYSLLYQTLGQTIEREPWTPLTNDCWDFDTEAIEDKGDYVDILKNLERISREEIKFKNPLDYVDLDEEKAWISFSFNEIDYKWNLKVNDDWVDENLFTKIVELTRKFKTKGKFTYFDTGGQNAVIGYETPETRDEIIKATGLKIEWLN